MKKLRDIYWRGLLGDVLMYIVAAALLVLCTYLSGAGVEYPWP